MERWASLHWDPVMNLLQEWWTLGGVKRVLNCFGNYFFFSGFFFWGVGGGFGAVQAPFWENPGVKGRFGGFFRTFGGGFRAVQAPFWGNQWWNAGSIQVWTQKTASKSKLSRSFLFSVCIYLCWCVCVCVCDRVCSMCFLSVVVLIFHAMHFFSCICNLSI